MNKKYLYMGFLLFLGLNFSAYAGAGGTSGKGEGTGVILILLLPYLIGHGVYIYLLRKRSRKDAWKVVSGAVMSDSVWSYDKLVGLASKTFIDIQSLWSKNDIEGSKKYLHPKYEKKYCSMLKKHIKQGVYNRTNNVNIAEITIVQAQNFLDDSKDMFVSHVTGTMDDVIVDKNGKIIKYQGDEENKASRSIDEYWYFQREGEQWLLCDINQKHTALFDVSIDEESTGKSRYDIKKLDPVLGNLMTSAKESKRRYIAISAAVGIAITVIGYGLYIAIGVAILG